MSPISWERLIPHHLAGFAKRFEGILDLPCHCDVCDEPREVALPGRVSEIARRAEDCLQDVPASSRIGAELGLVLLERALMLAHLRNVSKAEVPKAIVFRLVLVCLERAEKCAVLHDRAGDLALQKLCTLSHCKRYFSAVTDVVSPYL